MSDSSQNNPKINSRNILDNIFKIIVLATLPALLAGVLGGMFLMFYAEPSSVQEQLGIIPNKDPLVIITEPSDQPIILDSSNYFHVCGFASDESDIDRILLRYTLNLNEENGREPDRNEKGDLIQTRYFPVPVDLDGSWCFPISKSENEKEQETSNPVTITVRADDRSGNSAFDEITRTLSEEKLDITIENDSKVLVSYNEQDKSIGIFKNTSNVLSENKLIITGDIDVSNIEFKELKIRYSAGEKLDSLTGHKTIDLEKFTNLTSWEYKIKNPIIKKDFQIVVKVIDMEDKEYWIKYFVDLTNTPN